MNSKTGEQKNPGQNKLKSPLVVVSGDHHHTHPGVIFFGDEGGELGAEALHLLPPLPLDLLPLHRRRRCAAAAAVVAPHAASLTCRCSIAAAPALLAGAHLHR